MPAGAIAFPAYVLGQQFYAGRTVLTKKVTFTEAMRLAGRSRGDPAEGYATDRQYSDIFYVPENAEFSVREGSVRWQRQNGEWHQADASRRRDLRAALGYKDPPRKADGRNGVASGGFARGRNPLPQTMHRLRRRQVGDIEIDRQHHAERPDLRQRLPTRHRTGGGDPDEGFLARSTSAASPEPAPSGPF